MNQPSLRLPSRVPYRTELRLLPRAPKGGVTVVTVPGPHPEGVLIVYERKEKAPVRRASTASSHVSIIQERQLHARA
jgi:hypothetical protein